MSDFFRQFKDMNRNMPKSSKIIYGIIAAILLIGAFMKLVNRPEVLLMFIGLYLALVPAEVFRGAAAVASGDPTPKIWGKLSLNPMKHFDFLGFITPVVLLFISPFFIFGWVKTVPVNYPLVKKKGGGVLVVISLFIMNIINIAAAASVLKFMPLESVNRGLASVVGGQSLGVYSLENIAAVILLYIITVNLSVMLFNLLPVPPLEMAKMLSHFGGRKVRDFMESMENYGLIVLFVMLMFGLVRLIFDGPYRAILELLFKILGFIN